MRRAPLQFFRSLGFVLAAIVAIGGAILGWYQQVAAQLIIFYTAATFALVVWGWHQLFAGWVIGDPVPVTAGQPAALGGVPATQVEADRGSGYLAELLRANRTIVILLLLGAAAFAIASFAIDGFLTLANILTALAIVGYCAAAYALSRVIRIEKSAFIGIAVLVGLFIVGSFAIEGFSSSANIRSMLLFAAFLGLACVGQTLVALLGGLDLSIPFVIGSSNIALLFLITLGIPPWIAFIVLLCFGAAIGFVNGILSFRLQGQALIVTLGVGFAVSGITQIITSGNVFGTVPNWLINIATLNGRIFGLQIPPVIVIWVLVSIGLIYGLKNTKYGRNLYALGGSRVAADRLSISERAYWVGTYVISGVFASFTGALLLGWSGGGFIGVGDPYLFMTLAAVVVGGTSLLGGWGGYGFTVIGVLVLQVLTSFLVGIGLSFQGQQFVFGLLILPMVAIYGRSPHIRTQI